jgi:hypothetical protein
MIVCVVIFGEMIFMISTRRREARRTILIKTFLAYLMSLLIKSWN